MKINSKWKINLLYICSLMLIILFYVPFILKDKYFSYWDTYSYKLSSYNIEHGFDAIHHDSLYYFNQVIFSKITGLDYYWILKYGSIFFLFLFFLGLIVLFRSLLLKYTNSLYKVFIPISVIYISLFDYFYIRNTMTMRENLVLFVGLIAIFLVSKFNYRFLFNKNLFISLILLHSYIFQGHTLVNLVFSGFLFFYFIYLIYKYKGRYLLNILLYSIILVILVIPTLYSFIGGVFHQLVCGTDFLQEGYTVAYNFIKLSFFNFYDILIFIIGVVLLVINRKKVNITFFIYSLIIGIGYFTAFIEKFGSKQNRYAIYIFIIFGFFYILINSKFKNYLFSIILLFLIINVGVIENVIGYSGYFPLNENNIGQLQQLIQKGDIDLNKEIICGSSACTALNYLYPENQKKIINITQIPLNSLIYKNQVIYFKDDLEQYKRSNNQKLINFLRKNNNIFID